MALFALISRVLLALSAAVTARWEFGGDSLHGLSRLLTI
jgi:hypothetical protein